MTGWIDRFLAFALLAIIIVLTLTAIPSLGGQPLGGWVLLAHMAASGAMVFVLPAFAISGLVRRARHESSSPQPPSLPSSLPPSLPSSRLQSVGFWGLVVAGGLTIATVFFCMLPFPSTDQMHTLILWHGAAGYVMAVAALLFGIGWVSSRR